MRPRSIRAFRTAGVSIYPAVLLLLAFVSGGCAPDWPSDYPGKFQPVTGKIMMDGKPVAHVFVSFVPESEGAVLGSGETDEAGTYRISYQSSVGAPAGVYRVILSYRTNPKGVPISKAMDSSLLVPLEVTQAIERLPAKYVTRDTELKATVREGENVIDFELTGPLIPVPGDQQK